MNRSGPLERRLPSPFGSGWFIRECVVDPGDSPTMNLSVGARRSDIFYHYRMALTSATSDRVIRHKER